VLSTDSPVVGPKTAKQLAAFADEPEPPLASRDQVDVMITKIAIGTAQARTTDAEASEKLEMYWLALRDIPLDDLRWAFGEIIKTATFLPVPAEVRAVALKPGLKRQNMKSRARYLAWKHDQEWAPPIPDDDLVDLGELRATLESVTASVKPEPERVEQPKRHYCKVCLFASDNPLVAECQAENCGMRA